MRKMSLLQMALVAVLWTSALVGCSDATKDGDFRNGESLTAKTLFEKESAIEIGELTASIKQLEWKGDLLVVTYQLERNPNREPIWAIQTQENEKGDVHFSFLSSDKVPLVGEQNVEFDFDQDFLIYKKRRIEVALLVHCPENAAYIDAGFGLSQLKTRPILIPRPPT